MTADSTGSPAAGLRSPVVVTLTGLWEEALGLDSIGPDDDFVLIGGDSVGALTLLDMVEQVFGAEISPRALFDEVNTIRAMAARLAAPTAAAAAGQAGAR